MGVGSHLVAWITDLPNWLVDLSMLGWGTAGPTLWPAAQEHRRELCSLLVLFTLYTSDFQYKSEFCHVQKFMDDRNGQEDEYRELIQDFVTWCDSNHLLLNTTKTREMVVDFRRPRPHPEPGHHQRGLCGGGKDRALLYFLRRLASFNICKKLLQIFYQSVVA
ncbi:hypothetical protein L3Q82_009799 [Scortum barcoo]|uniref:Uncharacterized protein n=1 Tax=Scortum barcoo TaxID=214431 RepID=A0ACB8WE45_9TELE|nr:hypothetical protein L3Q82_009799 [Scortum barcoo]